MSTALAFVDFSDATTAVVETAGKIAHALGMKLILMHVSTPDAESEGGQLRTNVSREAVAAEMHGYHKQLELLKQKCVDAGVETDTLLVLGRSNRGNPVPKMVSELKRVKPTLIVMGTHQHGRFFEAFLGSASSKIVHRANCPTLLVPSPKVRKSRKKSRPKATVDG